MISALNRMKLRHYRSFLGDMTSVDALARAIELDKTIKTLRPDDTRVILRFMQEMQDYLNFAEVLEIFEKDVSDEQRT